MQADKTASVTLPDVTELVETLAARNWKQVAHAERQLAIAGDEGTQAVIEGMTHPNPRVRRACAGYMDHHGDDLCVAPLIERLLSDPVPNVRREALHSLACDRCKEGPLALDAIPLLLRAATTDPAKWVRYEALSALALKSADARVIAPLRARLVTESDPKVLGAVRHALRQHDPDFRAEYDEAARQCQRQVPIQPHKVNPATAA